MPKDLQSASASTRHARRHNPIPLHEELLAHESVRQKPSRQKRRGEANDDGEEEGHGAQNGRVGGVVDAGMSRKILQMAREQQDEVEMEGAQQQQNGRRVERRRSGGSRVTLGSSSSSGSSELSSMRFNSVDEEDENEEDEEYASYGVDGLGEEYEETEDVIVDEEDLALFNKFLPQDQPQRISLADKILEKIAQHEAALVGKTTEENPTPALPPKVVEVYTRVGQLLSRYKSGKLPKAFKIIPSLRNWEEILYLTRPDKWSPNACYEATKMFASNLKSSQTQKFMANFLLDRVRDDIHEHKKLNVHLYKCLKKSLYKPAAFFKGFLFPLCQSGTCTLKEAQIVGSVLTRVSVPVLHSAAALLRLAEMEYTGPSSIFIRVLLDKKYALPYKVVDSLVFHFMRFKSVQEQLPLLWHQSFLSFATRYKNDITEDQRDALLDVLLAKGHPLVGPEIRRELLEGRTRGTVVKLPSAEDDLMMDI
ncbi:Bystin-domain-containing protein [Kalaharituber pfeilii]|nr:Bystin-domain-containing protein [Kalaharituber pfeilii]